MGKRSKSAAAVLAAAMLVATACSEPPPEDDAETADETESDDAEPADDGQDTGDTADDSATDDIDDGGDAADGGDGDDSETAAGDEDVDEADDGPAEPADDADSDGDGDGDGDGEDPPPSDGSVVSEFAGAAWFLGEVPAAGVAAGDGEPIRIGMINQEDTPLGSFPEVRASAEAAVAWINAELGGVDGRPIELITCITSFDVEQSQSCALDLVQAGVVALVGGVDVTSNGSYPVIEQNGLAVVGGIPANLVEQRSPNAFFFSGGGAGAAAAYMADAADRGLSKVALAYGEFESFEVAARDYGAAVGESLGLEVELVPFSIVATDFLPIVAKAQDVDADALIVLAADSACVPVMETAIDLGYDGQLYLSGACAADAILDAAGDAAVGPIYNSEGPVREDVEGDLFTTATDRYATEPAGGAGTVGFRGMMNLYALMVGIGADVDSASLIEAARAAVDQPSFWGHPYTCDGTQVPGLPALCAPQQVLMELSEAGGDLVAASDWIDTPTLFAGLG